MRWSMPLAACAAFLIAAACRRPPSAMPASAPALLPPPTGPIHTLNESQVDAVLRDLHARESDLRRRVIALARRHLGQPYRLGLLGEGGVEPYDPDPRYCLTAGDCVTFVEQVWAMALAPDFAEFQRILDRIRYRDGRVGLLSRNHFTEADWNVNNRWLFDDLTAVLGAGRAAVPFELRIDRAAFFRKHGVGQELPVQRFSDRFIPRRMVVSVLSELRDADVIEFLRGTLGAPYVTHLGLVIRGPEGDVRLIHSGKPQVSELPLTDYLRRNPGIGGVKILRVRAGAG